MKIASWNINSVRFRMPIVERFLHEEAPDILCLQETKCPDHCFPLKGLQALGYRHVAQLLLARASDRAIEGLVLPLPLGASVFVDDAYFQGEGARYAVSAMRGTPGKCSASAPSVR